jgi:hypothetical protein
VWGFSGELIIASALTQNVAVTNYTPALYSYRKVASSNLVQETHYTMYFMFAVTFLLVCYAIEILEQ